MPKERLQKLLAAAGFGSRRACEEMILDGLVKVNGRVVMKLPVLVDPHRDTIQVGSRMLRPEKKVYFLLNKPKGVVCTLRDPRGRTTVRQLLADVPQRVFPVGRLDADSQGLVLMTNDGELNQRLTHPRYGVEKVYVAEVRGRVEGETVEKLLQGVWLAEGKARARNIHIVRRNAQRSVVQITLTEGKNRQVRRMLAKVGHPVRRLTRIRLGPLRLEGVRVGRYRPLSINELQSLRQAVSLREQPG